jgi:hypothetical protein
MTQGGQRTGSVNPETAITPADGTTTQSGGPWSALYIGGAGNVAIRNMEGDSITLTALQVGAWHAINFKRVLSTGTTATAILGGHIS